MDALQNISLRSIIENEEEAWIKQQNDDMTMKMMQQDKPYIDPQDEMEIFLTHDFLNEITSLKETMVTKIENLKNDFEDLKQYENPADVRETHQKLKNFMA